MTHEVIDSRVVEMRFDNKNFEKNVATSLTTLEKLKASLNLSDSAKGLDNISNAAKRFTMTGMSAAVDTVTTKFSALEVVAITALANITNSAVNAGKQLLKSVSIDQVRAGWEKYGNKTQSVATLVAQGYELDTVNEQLERLNWYTDETSYNFTDMVENISKFTAAGQDLETSVTAMEGIANWAALSGQNATTASRAMYQLSQAMGKGALKYDDFKSIQNASMDTREFRQHCLDAAVALGTLKKTGEDTYAVIGNEKHQFDINKFTDYLSEDAWLTSDVMMEVFNQYSAAVNDIYEYAEAKGITASEAMEELGGKLDEFGLKAFKAGQEARTFGDAVDSVRDAVSTAFMNTFELIFGDYEEATALWTSLANNLYDVFAEPINEFNEYLDGAMNLPERVLNAKDLFRLNLDDTGMSAFQKLLIETAKKHGVLIDEMIEEEGSFNATIKNGWLTGEIFDDAIKSISTLSTKSVNDLEKIRDAAVRVIKGDYGNNMEERFAKLAAEGLDPQLVQNYVNALSKLTNGTWELSDSIFEAADAQVGNAESLVAMSDAELESIGYTEEEIAVLRELAKQAEETGTPINELLKDIQNGGGKKSGREYLIGGVSNMLSSFLEIMGAIKEAWSDIFPAGTSEQLYAALEKFYSFTESIKPTPETLDKIKSAFSGLFSVLDIGKQIVEALIDVFGPIFGKIFGKLSGVLLNGAASLGDWTTKLSKSLRESEAFKKVIEPIGTVFENVAGKVWDGASALAEWAEKNNVVGRGFEFVRGAVTNAVERVRAFAESFRKLPAVQNALSKVSAFLERFVNKLKVYFGLGETEIHNFGDLLSNLSFDKLKEGLGKIVGDIKDYFASGKIIDDLKGAFSKVTDLFSGKGLGEGLEFSFDGVVKAVTDFGNSIREKLKLPEISFDGLKSKLQTFVNDVKEMFSEANWGAVIAVVSGLATLFLVKKVADIIKNIMGLGGLVDAVNNLLNAMAKEHKAAAFQKRAVGILAIAGAVAMLIGAITILGQQDLATIGKGIGGLILVSGVLIGLLVLSNKLGGSNKRMLASGQALLSVAGSVAILVLALKVLETIKIDPAFVARLATLAGFILGLIGALYLFNKIQGGNDLKKSAFAFVELAGSVLILAIALKEVSKIKPEKMLPSVIALGALMAALVGAMRLAGPKVGASGVGMLAMVASLIVLVTAIKMIAKLDPEVAIKGVAGVSILLLSLAGVFRLISTIQGSAKGAGVSILAISAAVILLTIAVKKIGELDASTAFKGIVGVITLMGFVSLLMMATANAGPNATKAGVAVLAVSVAIAMLALVISGLGKMDGAELGRGLAAVGVMMLLFTGLIAATKMLTANTGSLIALVAAVAVLSIAIGALSAIPFDKLIGAAAALTLVVGALALLIASTKLIGNIGPTLVALGGGLVALGAVVVALYVLKDFKGDDLLAKAEALSLVLVTIGGVCALLSALHVNIASAALAAAGLVVFMAIIGAVTAALGALNDWLDGGVVASLEQGIPVLETIGESLGAFFGGIASGFIDSSSKSLPDLGQRLSEFATNASGFFDMINGLTEDTVNNVSLLSRAILALTGGELLDAIASFISGGTTDLGTFGTRISTLGEGLATFATFIDESPVDSDKIQKAQDIADFFAKLKGTNIPTSGGLFSFLSENGDLSGFAEQLPTLGEALLTYTTYIDYIKVDETQIKKSEDIASFLASLSGTNIPTEGGLFDFLKNKNALTDFSSQLPTFAEDILTVSDKFAEITVGEPEIEKAKKIASFLAALGSDNESIQTGGLISIITGGQIDLKGFGKQLPDFGAGVKGYADAIKDLPTGKAFDAVQEKTESLAKFLATFATTDLGEIKTGGLLGFLSGNQISLSGFAEQLKPFGEGITAYAEALGDSVTSDKVDIANNAVGILSSFNTEIDSTSIANFNDFSGHLSGLGINIKSFSDKVEGISPSTLTSFGVAIANMSNQLNSMPTLDKEKASAFGNFIDALPSNKNMKKITALSSEQESSITEGVSSWLSAFNSSIGSDTTVGDTLGSLAGSALTALEDRASEFEEAGKKLLTSLKSGFEDGPTRAELTTSLETFVDSKMVKAVSAKKDDMKASGEALAKAMYDGAKTKVGEDKVKNVLAKAVEKVVSKVEKKEKGVSKAGEKLASKLYNGLKNKNEQIAKVFNTPINNAIGNINPFINQFFNAGKNIATALKNGLSNSATDISSAFNTSLSTAVETIRGYYGSFMSAGEYLVRGFAGGIELHTYVAKNAAARMAKASIDSANATLGNHSPSKVFYGVGSYAGQGFVNALYDYGDKAAEAGSGLADNARYGLSGAIGKVADVIESGMDAEPTIRPILDLSNVEEGMAGLPGMLGGQSQISMIAKARAISSGMAGGASRNQNEVISAIDRLSSQLATASGPSYTINGISYEQGSSVADAIETLVNAVIVNKRA